MERRGVAVVACGVVLMSVAYASAWLQGGAPVWGVWSMIAGTALLMSGMLAVAARRSGVSTSRAVLVAVVLGLILVGGFGLPMLLPAESATSPLVLGLPLRVAIEIYGVGLLPALFLPLVFAAEFRADGLDAASLDRLRHQCEQLRRTPGDVDAS